ncbi:TetR/AcrR family transcriptional regulator [Salipiger abyssi]|uniref:Transcriptional regulator n=1 Tax=Salipiger abyssi TaxID=1250539 RepID=A0A1P8UN76_9RHOB|nr:TetR/AcrR family transcriptional regulator [Salipiger abyssi]APZ50861.1 transcriptional regulator [Salipiger abyssi]
MTRPAEVKSPWLSTAERAAERETKREAVLRTAVHFFNTRGFHSTSLNDVAAALEVTKPTIYHYFSSKDEILFECVRLGLEAIRDAGDQARERGGSGRDQLEALMLEYALVMTRDFGICVSRTSDDQLAPASRDRFRALKREINDSLQATIQAGMDDASLRPGDARIAAFTVAGALNWIARWYRPDGGMSAEEVTRGVVHTLLSGLTP